MKEDLEAGMIAGAQLPGGGFGLGWESPVKRQALVSSCADVGNRSGTSCKRVKATQVNGFIVYTRTKKTKLAKLDREDGYAGDSESKMLNGLEEPKPDGGITSSTDHVFHSSSTAETNVTVRSRVENPLVESPAPDGAMEERLALCNLAESSGVKRSNELKIGIDESSLVEVVIEEHQSVEMLDGEISVEILVENSLDFDVESEANDVRIMDEPCCSSELPKQRGVKTHEGNLWRNRVTLKHRMQLTRSALGVDSVDVEEEAEPEFRDGESGERTPSGGPSNNSNLISKRPTTAKELFDTGLLDGVAVVYMGSFKSQAFGLRGIIKDGGILCSCSFCNWAQVIPTSKFEIHACKQYRRASQYICFENGKSLLDVLKICSNTPLQALEATIRDAVSGAPKERSFTCKRCKGVFQLSYEGQTRLLCYSCSEVAKSQASSATARTSKSAPVCMSSLSKSRSKITRKPSESVSSVFLSPVDREPQKIMRKAVHQALVGKGYMSASASFLSKNKSRSKFKKVSTKRALSSKDFRSVSLTVSSERKSHWKITRKDQRLHKLVFERSGLPDGTELAYYARGQKLLEGYKKGTGIYCYCCKCKVSPSQFEAHAGWASRRKPYAYIYTSNGVSLHEWAIMFSQGRTYSAKDSDDLCVICADGGNLLLCDGCPRAFHIECISLPNIPRGKWYCKYCEKRSEGKAFAEHGVNAVAAGRIIGVDPVDQVTGRCIRVVKNIEPETSGCVLCRGSDFSRSGFGPRTIIICDQCEKEYHIGCLRSHKMADLKELPEGKWFCCADCSRIHSTLLKLLLGGAERLSDSSLEIIRLKQERTDLDGAATTDIRWRLISGKVGSPESQTLLSEALAIFHDSFDPIVDPVSGRNLIPRMVYGKNMQGQDYGGMCCAVLTINSTVVSAGLLRVFGREVAELPLVATRMGKQGKGYFQLLFSCIEKLLSFLNVESIVLPAAEEAESLWMNKFGFKKLAPEQLSKYMKICYQMVKFKGASMLQKPVPSYQIIDREVKTDESLQENFE